MKYDAVIFDLDGLLLDTESLCTIAGQRAFSEAGLEAPETLFHAMIGVDTETCRQMIQDSFGDRADVDQINTTWEHHFSDMLRADIPVKQGAKTLLSYLHDQGIPRAIATSSSFSSAQQKVSVAGLNQWVDVVVTVDCVKNAKPAPDPYLEAAARLGVDPSRCLAFEDSDPGATAALSAGMTVVQIPDIVPAGKVPVHFVADTLINGAKLCGLIRA